MARLIFALLLVLAAAFGEGASLRRSLVKAVESKVGTKVASFEEVLESLGSGNGEDGPNLERLKSLVDTGEFAMRKNNASEGGASESASLLQSSSGVEGWHCFRGNMRIWYGQPQNGGRSVFSGDFHVRGRGVMWGGSCATKGVDANGYDMRTGGKAQIGGCGGYGFDDIEDGLAVKGGSDKTRITSVTVNHGHIVDSISVAYGANFPVKHGGGGGTARTLKLGSGEGIGRVRVCSGDFVDSVEFSVVNAQGNHVRSWRAGGHGGRWCKTYCPEKKGDVVTGFQGSAAVYLDALGVYFGENTQAKSVCEIAEKTAKVEGKWVAMKDIWKGKSLTISSGVTIDEEHVEEKSRAESIGTSISATISYGGASFGGEVTASASSELSRALRNQVTRATSKSFNIAATFTPNDDGVLWQYQVSVPTKCGYKVAVELEDFQITRERSQPPCCPPTYFKYKEGGGEHNGYTTCDDQGNALVKAFQKKSCPNLKPEVKQSCPSKDRWIPRYCGIYKRIGFCKYPWMKDVWCKKTCC